MYKCILPLKSRRPYLAQQLGHVLDMGDLLGLAVVQAASPGLVALHAVLDLRHDSAVRLEWLQIHVLELICGECHSTT